MVFQYGSAREHRGVWGRWDSQVGCIQALRCIHAHVAVVHAGTGVYIGTVVDATAVGAWAFVVYEGVAMYAGVVHRCAAAE